MAKRSAGLLMFRRREQGAQVFLAHPGGPLWTKKDYGAWTIPKGEYIESEDPLAAAQREFQEETGFTAAGPFTPLGQVKQANGKIVVGWAFEGDCDPRLLKSNTFRLNWPPGGDQWIDAPEVDRGEWFEFDEAKKRLIPAQAEFIDRLSNHLRGNA